MHLDRIIIEFENDLWPLKPSSFQPSAIGHFPVNQVAPVPSSLAFLKKFSGYQNYGPSPSGIQDFSPNPSLVSSWWVTKLLSVAFIERSKSRGKIFAMTLLIFFLILWLYSLISTPSHKSLYVLNHCAAWLVQVQTRPAFHSRAISVFVKLYRHVHKAPGNFGLIAKRADTCMGCSFPLTLLLCLGLWHAITLGEKTC